MSVSLNDLLKGMIDRKASDLHIRAVGHPVYRIDGRLIPLESVSFSPQETMDIGFSMMSDTQRKLFEERAESDLCYSAPGIGRFRANVYRQRGSVNIALRTVSTRIPSYEELNLPAVVKKLAGERRGLVLVTGTTGCGKSTTLASMIDQINATRSTHIITIEDPIEYLHHDRMSIVSQRELGVDTLSYAEALKHIVRQDPDVVLLGEMRDLETMSAALTAAQTGHLVLSTIHTIDAMQTVSRIIDLFPPHHQNQIRYQLADTLRGIISQRLLPHASGKGRIPAVEVLVMTALVRKAIEENNLVEVATSMRQGQYYGMQTFNQSLIKLYNAGNVTLEHALEAATNPEELMLAVRGIESGSDGNTFFEG